MIVSDGYTIEYYPKSNRIEIVMPQTVTTITNTVAMISNRRTDITELELTAILVAVKAMLERPVLSRLPTPGCNACHAK